MIKRVTYILLLAALIFYMGYFSIVGIGNILFNQAPSNWILVANIILLLASASLVMGFAIIYKSKEKSSYLVYFIFAILFLYNYGLMFQYRIAQEKQPRIRSICADNSGIFGYNEIFEKSFYELKAKSKFDALSFVTIENLCSDEVKDSINKYQLKDSFKNFKSSLFNKTFHRLKYFYDSNKSSYVLAQTMMEKCDSQDSVFYGKLKSIISNRQPNTFDIKDLKYKIPDVLVRFLPLLLIMVIFSLFAKNLGKYRHGFIRTTHVLIYFFFISSIIFPTNRELIIFSSALVFLFLLKFKFKKFKNTVDESFNKNEDVDFWDNIWVWDSKGTVFVQIFFLLIITVISYLTANEFGIITRGFSEFIKIPAILLITSIIYYLLENEGKPEDTPWKNIGKNDLKSLILNKYTTVLLLLAFSIFAMFIFLFLGDLGQTTTMIFGFLILLMFSRYYLSYSMILVLILFSFLYALFSFVISAKESSFALLEFKQLLDFVKVVKIYFGSDSISFIEVWDAFKNFGVFWKIWITFTIIVFVFSWYFLKKAKEKKLNSKTKLRWHQFFLGSFFVWIVGAIGIAFSFLAVYTRSQYRLKIFNNPFDLQLRTIGPSYSENWWDNVSNIMNSLMGYIDAGIFGAGIAMGGSENSILVQNDFIFSPIVEETGFIGGIALIIIIFYVVLQMLVFTKSADNGPSNVKMKTPQILFVYSVSALILAQTIVTIGGTMMILPFTGVPLFLIGKGFSSVITYIFLVSVVAINYEKTFNKNGDHRNGF